MAQASNTLRVAATTGRLPLNLVAYELSALPDRLDRLRIARYREKWQVYMGSDADAPERDEGENPATRFNYSKAFIDKSVAFLMGKGFSILADKEFGDIKGILEDIWQYNGKLALGIEMAQMGSITGDAFVKVTYQGPKEKSTDTTDFAPDDMVPDEAFLSETFDEDDMFPEGRVRLVVLPSTVCFPVYDPHDRKRMLSFTIVYPIYVPNIQGSLDVKVYEEIITAAEIVTRIDGMEIDRIPNPIGRVNVVHIPNLIVAGDSYGLSDIATIGDLQRQYDAKNTDVSDIIEYHAAPITIVTGAKGKDLVKGPKKVWSGLPIGSSVQNLSLEGDLSASQAHIDKLLQAMHELTSTPEGSLGREGAISNTTGVALQIKYGPLLEKTDMKRVTYGEGLVEICMLILRFVKTFGEAGDQEKVQALWSEPKKLRKFYSSLRIKFPFPLPRDELIQMQLISQKMGLGLEEPRGALETLGYEGDIDEKLQAIADWKAQQQQEMFDAQAVPYDNTDNKDNIGNVQGIYGAGEEPGPAEEELEAG